METATPTIAMHTLLLCSDVQFLGTTRGVLNELQVTPRIVSNCDDALAMIHDHEFDVIVVDWREIDHLGDFLSALRLSKLNHECVLVAIVRDLLDLRQAFAAGVHFLIHKPPSTLQIERCLRAAYCARVAHRRKQHREPVDILASISGRHNRLAEVIVTNLSEGGAGLRIHGADLEGPQAHLTAGEEVELHFALPGAAVILHAAGRVVWTTPEKAGIRFSYIPESERTPFESWLTECVEHSLAELCHRLRCA
jgi:CheY-like chemotaxis protein